MPLSQRLCRDTCTGIAALWNAVHARSTWCHQVNLWKRLRQLNLTQDSREEEPKSIVSEGNSRENLGRLNAAWYLTTSNIFHYEILLIYLGHSTYTRTPIFQSVMECIGLIFKWTQRERNCIHFEIQKKVTWDKKKKNHPTNSCRWQLAFQKSSSATTSFQTEKCQMENYLSINISKDIKHCFQL